MRALNYKTLHIMTFWNPIYFDIWILALLVAGTTTSIRSAPTVRCLNSRTWASGTSATSAWPRKSSYFNPLVFWHTKLFLARFARSLCVVLPWIVGANKANEYNKVVIKAQSSIFFRQSARLPPLTHDLGKGLVLSGHTPPGVSLLIIFDAYQHVK